MLPIVAPYEAIIKCSSFGKKNSLLTDFTAFKWYVQSAYGHFFVVVLLFIVLGWIFSRLFLTPQFRFADTFYTFFFFEMKYNIFFFSS